MPVSVPYVKPWFVRDGQSMFLQCSCGGKMFPKYGYLIDGDEQEYVWHVCQADHSHITQEIEVSQSFKDAFTNSG